MTDMTMNDKDEFTCIVCPRGCELSVTTGDGNIYVTGNLCMKGDDYGKQEISAPMRSLCTTVRTAFADFPRLPVRTAGDIPKDRIFDAMREINLLLVKESCRCGDKLLVNLLGLDIHVIATDTIGDRQ